MKKPKFLNRFVRADLVALLIVITLLSACSGPRDSVTSTNAAPGTETATDKPYKRSFFVIGRKLQNMLYEPAAPDEKSRIAILAMHIDNGFLEFSAGSELAKRGYRVLCSDISRKEIGKSLSEKLLDVKAAVQYLRGLPDVEKVILLGHSGGGNLMTAYQNAAENGIQAFQGPEKIVGCSEIGELLPADGLMLLDPNYGEGVLTLLSLDPAVTDEDSGKNLNPELDLYNPANGYNPEGSTYSDEFKRKFQKAQGERMNRLIDAALERWNAIQSGEGKYADDEPFIIPGASMFAYNNKLFRQDISLLSHTQKARPLLHADGSVTHEIIKCVRLPSPAEYYTDQYHYCSLPTTVHTFLDRYAIRTNNFSYDEDSMTGVDWASSFNCAPAAIAGVSSPLLAVGMTGGYEYLSVEMAYENATQCKDKTIAFVEGATHGFSPNKAAEAYPGQFGDTVTILYDYVDKWLSQEGRFMN